MANGKFRKLINELWSVACSLLLNFGIYQPSELNRVWGGDLVGN